MGRVWLVPGACPGFARPGRAPGFRGGPGRAHAGSGSGGWRRSRLGPARRSQPAAGGTAGSAPSIAPGTRPRQQSRWRRPQAARAPRGGVPAAAGRKPPPPQASGRFQLVRPPPAAPTLSPPPSRLINAGGSARRAAERRRRGQGRCWGPGCCSAWGWRWDAGPRRLFSGVPMTAPGAAPTPSR